MESRVINRIEEIVVLYFPMESRVILEDIYCRWLYFPMESRVINRIRRHLLSVGYIFPWKVV